MLIGKIKAWNPDRGFGWIAGDDGRDVFCHFTQMNFREPKVGLVVQYDTRISPRAGKPEAINVSLSDTVLHFRPTRPVRCTDVPYGEEDSVA
jgi:CspA family cold shock protein